MGIVTFFLFIFWTLQLVYAQQLFANTKFDLDSNLPAEEPVKPAANKDPAPTVVTKAPELVATTTPAPTTPKPTEVTKPMTTITTTTTAAPLTPPTISQLAVIGSGASPFSTLPPLIPLPSIADGRPLLPPQNLPIDPIAPAASPQQRIVPFATVVGTQVQHPGRPQSANRPTINAHLAPAHAPSMQSERVDLWFREDFDLTSCPRDGESISAAFRKKFPKNLLRNGKETILAELLSTRITECQKKQALDHWNKVEKVVLNSPLPSTEKEECRSGLVQEQISCLNVLSFSCQFLHSAYTFRLVPTRLIVQEARMAEDGSDKCRKFVRKFKLNN